MAAGTAAASPAAAAAPATVKITISARSGLPKVSGDTLVAYRGTARTGTATISGSVTGAARGDKATLLAKGFGGSRYSPAGKPVTLSGSNARYSFQVRPATATSYEVKVSGPGISGRPTSAARIVYVEAQGTVAGKTACARPVCHIRLRVWVDVPPSAYRAETAKHWYLYSGLRLAPSRRPAPPKILVLNRAATASKPQRHHFYQFEVTLRFRFAIGNHAYRWRVGFCTRDSEAADGLGLPGHHGCGDKRINVTAAYLG